MSKVHKIFYQSTDREKPWALELCIYYSYPKVFDIYGAVYHESIDRNVRSFYFTVYSNFVDAFNKIWIEIMEKLSARYDDFIISKADYQLLFSEFQRLLEYNSDDKI